METLLGMSTKELSRLEVMQRLSKKQMSQKEAGEILHLSTRQIKRLLKRYKKQGAVGLTSKHQGLPAANRLPESKKKRALDLLKTKY
jgi:transposase